MTEKVNKIKLPKYSSYLNEKDSELLDLFCNQYDCSKAKALPLLLKFWSENKDKVSNELATISNEDISAKKYDERLTNVEDKLATISYDTELEGIKERLATLENMLATISDNELAIISSELANDVQTEEKTHSECPTLPLNEDEGDKVPDEEIMAKDEQKELTDLQKEVLEKIAKIPSEEKFSLNSLSNKLGISRTVLGNFDHWKKHFSIIKKSRGCDYIKI